MSEKIGNMKKWKKQLYVIRIFTELKEVFNYIFHSYNVIYYTVNTKQSSVHEVPKYGIKIQNHLATVVNVWGLRFL